MNKFLVIILLLISVDLDAQLLNKILNATDDSAHAMYCRSCSPLETGGYVEKIYYLNDTLHSVSYLSSLDPKIRNGKYLEFHKNGKISRNCDYVNGEINGTNYGYYENGNMEYEENYLDGKLNGYLKSYYKNGILRRSDKYSNGEFIEGKCFGSKGQDTTYFVYSQMALFKNGDLEKYRQYVVSKLIYPNEAIEKGISGDVYVSFSVNSKGKVVDVEVIQSPHNYLSDAAIKVVQDSPDWKPAVQEGKKVKQNFVIPILFRFE